MGLRTWFGLKKKREVRRRVFTPPALRLFFLHMPKTGGTSLNSALSEAYPFWSQIPDAGIMARNFGKYPPLDVIVASMQFRPERVYYLRGHHHITCARLLGPDTKTLTLLRDPIERMISYYRHWFDQLNMSMESFEERFHADGFNLRYDNEMCRRLVGNLDLSSAEGAESRLRTILKSEISDPVKFLDDARRALDKCDFVGTLDTLPKLAKRLSDELEYDLNVPHQNRSFAPLKIADLVRERVQNENRLDVELYKHARAIAHG